MRRIPVVLVTATALLATLLAVASAPGAAGATPSPSVRLASDDAGYDGQWSAISSNGDLVAYQDAAAGTPGWSSIKVRDLTKPVQTGTLPTADTIATAPSMSGDASLVSFIGSKDAPQGRVGERQTYVVDRRNPDAPVVRAVTETPNDLPYQRQPFCGEASATASCEPRLSRDGKTLVAPVDQSIQNVGLVLTADTPGFGSQNLDNSGNLSPLVDLGTAPNQNKATLTVRNRSIRAVTFPDTGPTLDGDAGFAVTANTCAGVLQPDATCTVTIGYSSTSCGVESDGTLRFPATTPGGQTAVKLAAGGYCPVIIHLVPKLAAADTNCTGPSEYRLDTPRTPLTAETDAAKPNPLFRLAAVEAGQLGLTSVQLRNPGNSSKPPTLTSAGCQARFVVPPNAPPDTCRPDQPVPAQSYCTAYVEYRFAEVTPFFATFHVGDTAYRLSGHAQRSVVAAWRDPSGSGDFAASPATVVSAGGPDGAPVGGTQPSVSADGRWIAFTSRTTLGQPGAQLGPARVYLHDTDAGGDGSREPGQTVLMSTLPDGSQPGVAAMPSVSDDGTRVAFRASVSLNPEQIFVRDRTANRTVLASAAPDGSPGNFASSEPQLSGDGATVAYRSGASNLLADGPPPVVAQLIYSRDLTPDLAGGRGGNDLVSARRSGAGGPAGNDGFPSISQDGTQVAFQTDARIDGLDNDDSDDVYHSRRQFVLTAPGLDFGRIPVRSSSGQQVVAVRNDGPATAKLGKPYLSGPEFRIAADQCIGRVLHTGQSCNYTVQFTPAYVGRRTATLTAYNESGAGGNSLELQLSGTGTSGATVAGETIWASPDGGPGNVDPAISDDGRLVAYRKVQPPEGPNGIRVRDLSAGTTATLGEDGHREYGAPDISGNGRVVAYSTAGDDSTLYAADGTTAVHQVTDTTSDLRYQRPVPCLDDPRACKPSLSTDGTAIAFPARLDSRTPALTLSAPQSDGTAKTLTTLFDFGGGGTRIEVAAHRTVSFTGPPVIDGAGAYGVEASTCTGTLEAGQTCTIDLSFDVCGQYGPAQLRLQGATPAAQTALQLIGQPGCALRPARKAAACDPFPAPSSGPSPSTAESNAGRPLADAEEVPVGGTGYSALTLHNTDTVNATVRMDESCDFGLVTPQYHDPDDPPACAADGTVAPGASCIAYVAFRPSAVGPAAGWIWLDMHNVYDLDARFTGRGYRDVVVLRSDPSGAGDFAGSGKPAPKVVSVDGSGTTMTGSEPSLSGDGRYVAFTSGDPVGRDDRNEQVYRHDLRTGATALAGRLPDGKLSERGTYGPSLSRDGGRVAFVTAGFGGGDGGTPIPSQVWVRDLGTAKTVLASAAHGADGQRADGWSTLPALSDDGTTVAFSSDAGDPVAEPGNAQRSVYVRYLAPDLGGSGDRFGERVALTETGAVPEAGASTDPAINADGAFTAFESGSQLVAADNDDQQDVYVRRRPAQLTVEPASVDFGPARVGSTSGTRELVVRNAGPGPATVGPTIAGAPFAPGPERCQLTLHRGQSCTVDATFAPAAAGRADGLLGIPGRQGYLTLPQIAAALTGVGTAAPPVARFTATPGSLTFAGSRVGVPASDAGATVRNTGDVPLSLTATVTSPDGDFAADLSACTSLMPATTCEARVSFVPRKEGSRKGSIVLRANAQDPAVADPAARTVTLSGTGLPGPGPTPVAAMRVGPVSLVFGAQILTTASKPEHVAVDNIGTVPLRVAAQPTGADFTVDTSACRVVRPGQRCLLDVRFVPQSLGAQPGTVAGEPVGTVLGGLLVGAVSAGARTAAPFDVQVALRGTTAQPVLTLSPPTARQGQVVTAEGRNFPPGRTVALNWQQGLGAAQAAADRTGRFRADLLVFTRDALGPRLLAGTIPGQPRPISSPPLLVLPPSQTPPDFVTGW